MCLFGTVIHGWYMEIKSKYKPKKKRKKKRKERMIENPDCRMSIIRKDKK